MATAVEWASKPGKKIGFSKSRTINAGINWNLASLMTEQGVLNADRLHDLMRGWDIDCTAEEVDALYHGWMPARTGDGEWHPVSLGVCEVLGCTPEAAFDHEHQWHPDDVVGNLAAAADYEELERRGGSSQGLSPDDVIQNEEVAALVRTALRRLTPREEQVIRLRFGFGCEVMTYEEIASKFGLVSRERIRQIEAKALRRLKHPANAGNLKDFFPNESDSRRLSFKSRFYADRHPDRFVLRYNRKHILNCGTDGIIAWPSLKAYDLEMKVYELSNGRSILVIGVDHSADNYKIDAVKDIDQRLLLQRDALLDLGFRACRNGTFANFEATFSIDEFVHRLPLTTKENVVLMDVIVRRQASPVPGVRM